MSKCAMCEVEGAPLASRYLQTELGRSLCACCRIVAFNRRYHGRDEPEVAPVTPETNEFARRFAVMAEDAIAAHERRDARRPVTPSAAASWAAHSCPDES